MPPKNKAKANAKAKKNIVVAKKSGPARVKNVKTVIKKELSAERRKEVAGNNFSKWNEAVRKAKAELGFTGFVPIGGKTIKGAALLSRARLIYGTDTSRKQSHGILVEEARDALRSCEIGQIVDTSISHLSLHAQFAQIFSEQASANSSALGQILADMLPTVQKFFVKANGVVEEIDPCFATPRKVSKPIHIFASSLQKEAPPHKRAKSLSETVDPETQARRARNYAESLRLLARAIDDVRVSVADRVTASRERAHEALQAKIKEQDQIIIELQMRCYSLEQQVAQSTSGNSVRQFSTQLMQLSDAQAQRVIAFQDHLRQRGNGDIVSESWRMIEEERQIELTGVLERMHKEANKEAALQEQIQIISQDLQAVIKKLVSWSTGVVRDISEESNLVYEDVAKEICRSILKSKNQVIDLVSEIEVEASAIEAKLCQATDLIESLSEQQAQVSESFVKHAEIAAETQTTFGKVWQGAVESYLHIVGGSK